MSYTGNERRKSNPLEEKDLYHLRNLEEHIQKERRADELDRLREVKEQKSIWLKTVIINMLMIILFITCAVIGAYYG